MQFKILPGLVATVVVVAFSGCGSSPTTNTLQVQTPETVQLSPGSYYMGDHSGSGDADERPLMEVSVQGFAISKHEITFAQFDEFAQAKGIALPQDAGWGRDQKPAINVSWQQAIAYTQWLSENTGQKWRLPSEKEWEYAARAGAVSNFHNGNQQQQLCQVANIADSSASASGWVTTDCNDSHNFTSAVGSYRPNANGIYDMHGNVWEWVSDCYQAYDAPKRSSRPKRQCAERVIRGGSYKLPAASARLSNREKLSQTQKSDQVGFRVVREL